VVNFNFGGTRISTALAKLTTGRAADTFFAQLLSGRHEIDEKEIFLDRDGRAVHVLFNYFRNPGSFTRVS
jgi:hypothetical protein